VFDLKIIKILFFNFFHRLNKKTGLLLRRFRYWLHVDRTTERDGDHPCAEKRPNQINVSMPHNVMKFYWPL